MRDSAVSDKGWHETRRGHTAHPSSTRGIGPSLEQQLSADGVASLGCEVQRSVAELRSVLSETTRVSGRETLSE